MKLIFFDEINFFFDQINFFDKINFFYSKIVPDKILQDVTQHNQTLLNHILRDCDDFRNYEFYFDPTLSLLINPALTEPIYRPSK